MGIRGRWASAVCASLALLAACDGGGSVSSVPHYVAAPGRPDLEASWVSPDAGGTALLYVSDWFTNTVFIYDFATHGLLGRLTGFQAPYGQCVGANGRVWIAEFGVSDVVEYPHGGKNAIKRLHTDGHPIGCAVDPARGNLAVANFYAKGASGSIQVWKDAKGAPTTYRSAKLYYFWPPAYDDSSNLFIEGKALHGDYGVAELPSGAKALRNLELSGAVIRYAGGALWDGAHIGLTDQSDGKNGTAIYRTRVANGVATVIGRTRLSDTCYGKAADIPQPFFVHANKGGDVIIGGNLWCLRRFGYWNYPAGGNPSHFLARAPKEPFGQSVSLPPR